jgi:hypothetical protein
MNPGLRLCTDYLEEKFCKLRMYRISEGQVPKFL